MKLGHWQRFQKFHIYSLSNPRVEIELIFAHGQQFPRYRSIIKIAIFGHWPKSRMLHIYSLPHRVEIELFHSTGSRFWDASRFSTWPLAVTWPFNLAIGSSSRSSTCTLILSQLVEIELVFALQTDFFRDTGRFSNCHHIWAWNLVTGQSSSGSIHCIYSPSSPRRLNWPYFCFTCSGFQDTGHFFQNCQIFCLQRGSWQISWTTKKKDTKDLHLNTDLTIHNEKHAIGASGQRQIEVIPGSFNTLSRL